MNRVRILDCTLRDGGYINNCRFGESVIKSLICKLTKASIDIIECGWLKSGATDKDCSCYGSVESIKELIGKKNPNLLYVAMVQYGAITNKEISSYDPDSIDGIRITFHECEIEKAFVFGKQLMQKGYKVFMQPVGTTTYTDEALIQLIQNINELKPYAFYLVDTLGTMYKNDLLRMFYLIDHNLDKNIVFGFHSHNNLQLSFANAQELLQINTPRQIILDSSVYGMGRGAGNLNTELLTQYININHGLRYDNLEILEILDEYIKPLSVQYKWGYDAGYYIASVTGCHPNYASFLLDKQTLHVQDIHSILSTLDIEKRGIFDKKYIGEMYTHYMNRYVDDQKAVEHIKHFIGNKPVLLLAPGKSLKDHVKEINHIATTHHYYIVSVNFIPRDINIDMMFVSNMKRFDNIDEFDCCISSNIKIVITSNITTAPHDNVLTLNYFSYTNEEQCILDNAGLMCFNLLKKIGVTEVLLAGFDGFSSKGEDNYFKASMYVDVGMERAINMNKAITEKLRQLGTHMKISYFTNSIYEAREKDGEI